MVTHGNLLHNFVAIVHTLAIHDAASYVFWLPPYHDLGLIGGILSALYRGGTTMLMSPLHLTETIVSSCHVVRGPGYHCSRLRSRRHRLRKYRGCTG